MPSNGSMPAPGAKQPRLPLMYADGTRSTIAGPWRMDPNFREVLQRADVQADLLRWNRLSTRGFLVEYSYYYFEEDTASFDQRVHDVIHESGTLEDAAIWRRFMQLSRAVRGHQSMEPPPTPQEAALSRYCDEVGHERLARLRNLALEGLIEDPENGIQRRIHAASTQSAIFQMWNLLASGKAPLVLAYLEDIGVEPFQSALDAVDQLGPDLREAVLELVANHGLTFDQRWPFDDEYRQWLAKARA